MRTTIDLPDELLRQAKARAAFDEMRLRDLIEKGLRLALATPSTPAAPAGQMSPAHSRPPGTLTPKPCVARRSRRRSTKTPPMPVLCDVNVLLALVTTGARTMHSGGLVGQCGRRCRIIKTESKPAYRAILQTP